MDSATESTPEAHTVTVVKCKVRHTQVASVATVCGMAAECRRRYEGRSLGLSYGAQDASRITPMARFRRGSPLAASDRVRQRRVQPLALQNV